MKNLELNTILTKSHLVEGEISLIQQIYVGECIDGLLYSVNKPIFYYAGELENFNKEIFGDVLLFTNKELVRKLINTLREKNEIEVFSNEELSTLGFDEIIYDYAKNFYAGRLDFENKIAKYIHPFINSNENIIIAILKIIREYENFKCPPPDEFTYLRDIINISSEGYRAGILERAYFFIATHIDFFIKSDIEFIDKVSKNQISLPSPFENLQSKWNINSNYSYNEVVNCLKNSKFLIPTEDKNYAGLIWTGKKGQSDKGGADFSCLLEILDEFECFNYRIHSIKKLRKICINSFTIEFSEDSFKGSKIQLVATNERKKQFLKESGLDKYFNS